MADLVRSTDLHPGTGIDFTALGWVLAGALVLYVAAGLLMLDAGPARDRGRAADGGGHARRHRDQGQPAAARLHRLARARRADVAHHQRHRQHRPVAAADDQPAADVGADGGRHPRDDALDLAAARGRRPPHDPARHLPDPADHQAVAAAVRGTVARHRQRERPHRRGLHGPRDRQGLRPPGRGTSGVRPAQRHAVRRGVPGAVHLRHHPAGHDVRVERELRHRGCRRSAARGVGQPERRRRAGVHPVLAAVHPAAHPDRLDDHVVAVGPGVGRAGLQPPRRDRGERPIARTLRSPIPCAAGWSSRTSRSRTPTSP